VIRPTIPLHVALLRLKADNRLAAEREDVIMRKIVAMTNVMSADGVKKEKDKDNVITAEKHVLLITAALQAVVLSPTPVATKAAALTAAAAIPETLRRIKI
jgi:hypothetical protein